MIDPAACARVERWKLSLLDLSADHPLLDIEGRESCLELPGCDVLAVAQALAAGNGFGFAASSDPGSDTGRLRTALPTEALARRLGGIRRAARARMVDAGEHTLWLGLGLLTWCGAEGTAHTAPLALWPAELERGAGGGLRLVPVDAVEPCVNPLLVEKLRRDFALVLAPPTDDAGRTTRLDVAQVLEAAASLVVTRPGWRVERAATLGVFSFAELALWADLERCGDAVLASSVVAHLAADARSPRGPFAQPSIAAAEAVTRPRVDGDVLAPLDADASQLAAIAAAAAGATFVLQAAPGTGKAQTIANLIAHCASNGKTVLCVSEKAAALEAVQQRLATVGLGELCLELHGAKATRARVLGQLGRVVERTFRPGTGPVGADARLSELRGGLDAHVAALHKVGPFGLSLHEVLGRLVELRSAPRAELAERDATGLDRATYERRRSAVAELAAAALPVEPVASHPWRTSTLEATSHGAGTEGRTRALAALDELAEATTGVARAVGEVASLVPGLVVRSREQLQALGALAAVASASPRPGAELLTNLRAGRVENLGEQLALIRARGAGSVEVPRDPHAFLALATRHRALAGEVAACFTDAVDELDAHAVWAQLRKWAGRGGPLRYVALRTARAEVRAAARPGALDTDEAMLAALEAVIAERACRAALRTASEPAKRWFGELGGEPLALDLARLEAAVAWAGELRKAFDALEIIGGDAGRASAWRALVAQVAAGPAGTVTGVGDAVAFARLAEAVGRWSPALSRLASAIGIDVAVLAAGDDHLAALRERIETLRHAIDSLGDWVRFHAARHAALAAGVGPAVAALERGDLAAADLAAAWERATLLAWATAELAESPALARFHGAAHHAEVAAFADLDRGALALARGRAVVRFAERVPRITADASGELGILAHELKAQAEPRSLRQLFAELPTVLPRIAPCLLMTPLSVAQLLEPGAPRFDVVVLDEASQLALPHALGALARGSAAVIVGDARQLPPPAALADDVIASVDGVLETCLAAGLPELRLAWHYRSKHEDLIALANRRYYDDRLQVFPAAQGSPELGVTWRNIDGTFDHEARHNRAEAEAVVADALARLRDPAQRSRSLAIVTFARGQQTLIEDLLDEARDADPALDALIEPPSGELTAVEPLLVTHVDELQGHERDVVLVSVGYGPASAGGTTTELGVLAHPAGERRVAVALTCAREQLVWFSSFAPEDVAAITASGVRELAEALAFARRGGGAARPAEEQPPANPITAAMARALIERGWSVRHQVGCGAYKIDLAVVDPNDDGRYVLAIEDDGRGYASAPAARDRDRVRAQVLSQLGWRLHRVWALDWWADPEREIQRAHGAIVTAIAATRQRRSSTSAPTPRRARASAQLGAGSAPVVRSASKPASVEVMLAAGSGPAEAMPLTPLEGNTTPTRLPRNAIAIGSYAAAAIPAGRRTPDDLFAPRHLAELGKVVEQVLAAEAPMHVDLLARRVGGYFGIGRVTQRVADQVRIALTGRARWGEEPNVVWRPDQDPTAVPAVRVAGQGPAARRAIEEVPLAELAAAARIVVERASGISTHELVRDSARLLGFARITDQVTERVTLGVRLALARELIRISDGRAVMPLD